MVSMYERIAELFSCVRPFDKVGGQHIRHVKLGDQLFNEQELAGRVVFQEHKLPFRSYNQVDCAQIQL